MSQIIPATDEEWSALTDEKELRNRRLAAEKKYSYLGNTEIQHLRRLCKSNLFFLASSPLEYKLLSETFHGHYVRWLQQTYGERYRMTLLPRDHYKSTINTICDSVQMALPNDAGIQSYPYTLGPNIKLLLAHETRETASRFLFEITRAFMDKPLMLALFPECIPSKKVQRVNKFELDLPRQENPKEPTFDTIGVGGAAQSRHFNWLKLDDLVGEEARDSETVMKRVLMWFDNINSLLTRLKIDGWDLTGTRWSRNDVYGHATKMYGVRKPKSVLTAYFDDDVEKMRDGQLSVYARPAIEHGEPVFPEEFTLEDLNRIRQNPVVWAAQYANNPRASELTELPTAWLKFYNVAPNGRITVFAGDGTGNHAGSWTTHIRDLDRVVMIDPSMGENAAADESGIVVTGTDKRMNIYILEAWKARLKPPELMDVLFQLYTKWNPRLVSIEEVAFSGIYKYWFQERCTDLGIYPSIYPYKRPGGRNAKSKKDHIRAISNYAASGQVYALEGMHQLRDEWEWFPMSDSEHILDALSHGPEIWSPGLKKEDREGLTKAEESLVEQRDALTGY